MAIKYDNNCESVEELSITGPGNDWGIRGDKLWVTVDNVNITPYSEDECIASVFGEGVKCLTDDIITMQKENEALKETTEVLQRQLEKERNKNTDKSELEQVKKETVQDVDNDRDALHTRGNELYTTMKILIARHNETVMENNRLRKRNRKLREDFESIKGHLRCAQYKLDKYERDKPYSKILVDDCTGQRLCFKNAKVSLSSDGTVSVIGESADSLVKRMKELIDTEKKFKEWQSIVLKNLEGHVTPSETNDIFNEHIKEN